MLDDALIWIDVEMCNYMLIQVVHKLCEQMQVIMIVIVILSRMCMSNVNELICEVLSSRVFVIECYYFESMNDFAQAVSPLGERCLVLPSLLLDTIRSHLPRVKEVCGAVFGVHKFVINIQPCSHVSDITVSRAFLFYYVLRGMSINIGQVLANEKHVCANIMNNKAPLGHPSLITHLCELAGVNISTPPFERPRKAIDEAYYRKYCGGDESAQQVPPCNPRRGRGPPQGQAPTKPHEPF
ncbi:hypothetical protein LR48_Vigan10s001000 [Vigna angularis]|uniref:Putative plant transposon protein domain-containing protein n=1 Tax=Phaseolus angularis TaxID=3914 RepID=A0A0L9T3E1_PHAAN|nr:hypothetical protein LR48_Vigan10s001000 [Vigna angularis]